MEAPAGRAPRPARQAAAGAGDGGGAGHHLLPRADRAFPQPRGGGRGLHQPEGPQPGLPRQATLMSDNLDVRAPSAAFYACAGLSLTAAAVGFFRSDNTLGFTLYE